MAKATKGKRTTNKAALKRRAASERKPMRSRTRAAFPGGSKLTKDEVKRVVPRMTRA